ncbi:MAG: hypothetical protein KDC67_03960 [Ignavibacteriae bacterium]|nr:hypothetical protein [Ignavibacteriota bacterium]
MSEKRNLPTIKDLVTNVDLYNKQDEFQFLVNQEPPEKWIKTHPYIKNHKYIPIDKIEYLLRSIFKNDHRIEILNQGTAFNGVWMTVRVHYKDLITSEWKYYDGVGACELQTKKGTSPADLSNINNGALSMAFPIAKTLAIKDACDHFGNLFGANLNRKDIIPYKTPESLQKTPEEKLTEIELLLEVDGLTITEEDRMNIERIVEQKEEISYNKCLKLLNNNLPKKS